MRIRHKRIKNICVIQLQPFGDVFLTTSYFRALKAYFPGSRLTYLMKEPYQKIVKDHPFIDRIITIRKARGFQYVVERLKTFRLLRREAFDLVIDQQNMPSSQVLAFVSGAPYRLGYKSGRKNLDFLYNIHAVFGPTRYSAQQKFDIVKPLGMPESPCHLVLPVSETDQRDMEAWMKSRNLVPEKTLALSPGSRFPFKKWPAAAYAQVADLLAEACGFRTVILWGPGEEADARLVQSLMKKEAVIAPPTTFQQAGVIMKKSAVLVCNDNGISHSAAAFGVKTVTVFGPTDPLCWSPSGIYKTHRHLHNLSASKTDANFGITPFMVYDIIMEQLNIPAL